MYVVGRATRESGTFVTSSEGTVPWNYTNGVELVMTGPGVAYLWEKGPSALVELLGPTQGTEHLLIPLTGLAVISDVRRGAANTLFVQGTDAVGNGGITRLDIPAFTATQILPPGDFSLTAISPSKTGELWFAGLRNSDGKRVIGTVPAGSITYTITSETAPNITYLQRIN